MNRRPSSFVTLMVILGIVAMGCTGPQDSEKLKIAYIRPTNDPYHKHGFDGAKMMGKAMDAEVQGFISNMSSGRELASIEEAISQKMDGIVLLSVNAGAMRASINAAHEAGIPIFIIHGYNRRLMDKMVGTVLPDCNLWGSNIGKWVVDNVSEGEIACIMGLLGRDDAECYRDAFERELSKNPNLELVASVPGDWNRQKAFEQMQNLIGSHPDLQAVFVQNEDMALGAILALKEAGKEGQVQIVSQNGAPQGLESIAADGIKATVSWSPSQEAALAMRMLIEHIRGTEVPQLTITPMKVITKANLGDAAPWTPTDASTRATMELDLDALIHEFDTVTGS